MDPIHQLSPTAAYIMGAVLSGALYYDIRSDICRIVSGRNVVLIAIAAWFLLEPIMLPEALKVYDQSTYDWGVFYVFLAFASFLVGYHATSGCGLFPAFGDKIQSFDDEKWLWRLVVVGAVIGFTPVVIFTGSDFVEMFQGMLGMRSTWGGLLSRGRYGDARAAFLMIEMFVGAVAPFAAILFFDRKSTHFQRVFCAAVTLWPMLRAYGSGTRSAMIIAGGCSVVAVLYWKASHRMRKIAIYIALLFTPLFYGVMAAIVASRNAGALDWESRHNVDYVGNEMFRELLYITTNVPSRIDYQWGFVYYVQLVNPIPRFLWPDKPTLDTGLLLASMYDAVTSSGEAYLTVSPGLIGEMYLNFGIYGIIGLSFFGGWLVKGWDRLPLLYPNSFPTLMFYSGGLGVLFIMGRSFTMGMFYGLMSLALLAWAVRSIAPRRIEH